MPISTKIAEVSSLVCYEPGLIIEGPELPIHQELPLGLTGGIQRKGKKPIRLASAQLHELPVGKRSA